MTNIFAVVGEHRREPGRLLLLGEDGRYYAYAADGPPIAVEPTGAWRLDEDAFQAAGSRGQGTGGRGQGAGGRPQARQPEPNARQAERSDASPTSRSRSRDASLRSA